MHIKNQYQVFFDSDKEYPVEVIDLLQESVVIDMLHPIEFVSCRAEQWIQNPEKVSLDVFERYQESGLKSICTGHVTSGPEAYITYLKLIASWNSIISSNDDKFLKITKVDDFDRARADGKLGILLSNQCSDHFRTIDDVSFFYNLGQRISQLTYNERNRIGDGSTERTDSGISDFGVDIIEKMDQLGMAVDVSHCGDRTTLDAFEFSNKPVLMTHANCRALNDHPRCKTDEAIKEMAKNGGVMGITFLRMFVRGEDPVTLDHVIDHYEHIAKLVGVEHLGLGTDYDLYGYDQMLPDELEAMKQSFKRSYAVRKKVDIEGLNHPKKIFDLANGLLNRGFSKTEIIAILGGNLKRVLKDVFIPDPSSLNN